MDANSIITLVITLIITGIFSIIVVIYTNRGARTLFKQTNYPKINTKFMCIGNNGLAHIGINIENRHNTVSISDVQVTFKVYRNRWFSYFLPSKVTLSEKLEILKPNSNATIGLYDADFSLPVNIGQAINAYFNIFALSHDSYGTPYESVASKSEVYIQATIVYRSDIYKAKFQKEVEWHTIKPAYEYSKLFGQYRKHAGWYVNQAEPLYKSIRRKYSYRRF